MVQLQVQGVLTFCTLQLSPAKFEVILLVLATVDQRSNTRADLPLIQLDVVVDADDL